MAWYMPEPETRLPIAFAVCGECAFTREFPYGSVVDIKDGDECEQCKKPSIVVHRRRKGEKVESEEKPLVPTLTIEILEKLISGEYESVREAIHNLSPSERVAFHHALVRILKEVRRAGYQI